MSTPGRHWCYARSPLRWPSAQLLHGIAPCTLYGPHARLRGRGLFDCSLPPGVLLRQPSEHALAQCHAGPSSTLAVAPPPAPPHPLSLTHTHTHGSPHSQRRGLCGCCCFVRVAGAGAPCVGKGHVQLRSCECAPPTPPRWGLLSAVSCRGLDLAPAVRLTGRRWTQAPTDALSLLVELAVDAGCVADS